MINTGYFKAGHTLFFKAIYNKPRRNTTTRQDLLSSSRRGSSSLMWTSKPGISRVQTAKSSFPTRSRLILVVTEDVMRPSLFSEDFENVSPLRATKLEKVVKDKEENLCLNNAKKSFNRKKGLLPFSPREGENGCRESVSGNAGKGDQVVGGRGG